jgi:hypothetical protein
MINTRADPKVRIELELKDKSSTVLALHFSLEYGTPCLSTLEVTNGGVREATDESRTKSRIILMRFIF